MDDLLTSKETAELLGVGPTAIKRWTDEGRLPCVKTAGGHRRIRREDVEKFLHPDSTQPDSTPPGPDKAISPDVTDHWIQTLLQDDPGYALEGLLLVERGKLGSWAAVADKLGLVLNEIGNRWAQGKLGVLEEHLASDRLIRSLLRVSESITLPSTAPKALLVSPDGEEHTMGLSLLEVALKEKGWKTHWAGHRSPLSELVDLVHKGKVKMVASSASSYLTDEGKLRKWLGPIQQVCEKTRTLLLLGGRGNWPAILSYGIRVHQFVELDALVEKPAKVTKKK